MRTGLLGKKLGMTRIFTEDGRWIPVTLLEVGPCAVVQRKTRETDGYEAIQLGFGELPERKCTKPEQGHFNKANVTPRRFLREFRVDASCALQAGDELKADLFGTGDRIAVSGTTKGKGFAGVHRRHSFQGGPGTHGSNFHRVPGSIGQSADPSKVVKGKRMPGHMGRTRVTTANIEVVLVDAEKNLLAVRGTVPGPAGGVVELTKQA